MPQTATLDAIGLKYGTDKASFHHNYLEFYEGFFAPLRNEALTILEIGVLNGASLKTWEEYFPNAKVIGADIMPATKKFEQGRVVIELLDQSNIEELTRVAVKHGPFDIIIEDGSHMWEHQITTLRTLFPFVKDGGIYVVEDLQTNYGSMQKDYKGIASATCVDYLKSWLDLRVADDQLPINEVEDAFLRTYGRAVQYLTFYRRACLIKKSFPTVMREISAGQPLMAVGAGAPLRVLAHISEIGDVTGTEGFVNPGADNFTFQGLAVDADEDVLEYRVRFANATWSEWCHGNGYAGTRAQSRLVTGVSLRLRKQAKGLYALRGYGRFAGSAKPVEIADGVDCVSLTGGALCALQVELTPHAQG